jgi:hypothetical protein
MRHHLVLLTATITPAANQPELLLSDPQARLREYETALAFYAGLVRRKIIAGVVFAENSGFDLNTLKHRFQRPGIEWLSLPVSEPTPAFHRGYSEIKLVEEALSRSSLFAQSPAHTLVWKISGRYIVRNLQQVVRWAPRGVDYYGELRPDWAEMSVMAWSRQGYRQVVQGLWRQLATAAPPEPILRQVLQACRPADLRVCGSFVWPPFIVGRRGSDGTPFQGRFTPYKFKLQLAQKLLALPLRRLINC